MSDFGADNSRAFGVALEETMQIARVAAGNLCDNVIDKTPVLTRNLQSGWRGTTEAGDVTELPIQRVANIVPAETTKAKIREAIAKWDGFKPFLLHNPVIYGVPIEYEGWSGKAPRGMVRVTAAQWPLFVQDAVRQAGGH